MMCLRQHLLNGISAIQTGACRWSLYRSRPYYLAQLAQDKGYHPEVILAGRRINDGMGEYVAQQIVKCMIRKDIPINKSKVLVLGFTFKENCPDVRNTKVSQVVESLADFGVGVTVYDPWAKPAECMHEYGIEVAKRIARRAL